MEFTVHRAKPQFSKLIAHALTGEEVLITRGKQRKQIVKIVPVLEKKTNSSRLAERPDS